MQWRQPCSIHLCDEHGCIQPVDAGGETTRRHEPCFQIELTHKIWRQGMRIVEIPIIFTERFQGHSKMSRKIVWEALAVVWVLLLQNGLRRSPGKEK